MGIVVFDADVLIAYRSRSDAQHDEACDRIRRALVRGVERLVCAVTYTELLVGPLRRRGAAAGDRVEAMFRRFRFEVVPADAALARSAAAVRAQTNLAVPDGYVVATALAAGARSEDVRLESFDRNVIKAHATLLGRD